MLGEGRHALDPGRLEDAPLPDRVGGHLAPDGIDDRDRRVDVGPVGDRDVWLMRDQTRVRLEATWISPLGTVWTTPSRSRSVVRRRVKSSTVPDTPGDPDDVALGELVLDEDQRAVQVVADEALGPEPDGDPDDAEARDRRPDVEPELAEDISPAMATMKNCRTLATEPVERVHPLLELDRAQLLGRALGRLAVEQRLDDAVDEEPGEAQRDDARR